MMEKNDHQERYELIEKLVEEFNSGNKSAGNELIKLFYPLFNKYIKTIKYGQLDFGDSEARLFVGLFIADSEVRRSLRRNKPSKAAKTAAYRILDFISVVCYNMTDEDFHQEFSSIIFKLARSYKVKKSFTAYVGSSFKYEVSHMLKKIMSDPLNKAILINFSDESAANICGVYNNIDDDIYPDIPDELDNNWIYGATCDDIFKGLDVIDRLILKLSYADKMSDIEIGKKIGYHRNWVGIRRRAAIDILRDQLFKVCRHDNKK